MNLETTWTKDALRQAQKDDPDMKMLYELKHDNGEKPGQCVVSGLSAAGKSYMRDWALIRMKEGLLYRYYEDAARSEKYYQLLVPECYQQELLVSAHDQGTPIGWSRGRAMRANNNQSGCGARLRSTDLADAKQVYKSNLR